MVLIDAESINEIHFIISSFFVQKSKSDDVDLEIESPSKEESPSEEKPKKKRKKGSDEEGEDEIKKKKVKKEKNGEVQQNGIVKEKPTSSKQVLPNAQAYFFFLVRMFTKRHILVNKDFKLIEGKEC